MALQPIELGPDMTPRTAAWPLSPHTGPQYQRKSCLLTRSFPIQILPHNPTEMSSARVDMRSDHGFALTGVLTLALP